MIVVFLHQLHDNLRSLRFQTSLIVLLLFFVGNGIVYTYKMGRALKETVQAEQSDESRYEGVETLRQAVDSHFKIRAPLTGTEFIVEAGSDWFPYGMIVSVASGRTTDLSSARTSNYWMREFEVLDWTVIVRYLLSFLCIVLSYNAISGELEGGTLRLALANSLSRAQFLIGKFLAHLVILVVALVLGSLVSLAILALNQVLELNWFVARCYLFFLGGAVVYIALFLLLGIGVSTVARNSATALVVLVMTWTVLVVVIPQTSYLIATRVVESVGLYWERLEDYENDYRASLEREGVAPRQPELARTDNYDLEKHYASRMRDMEGELDRMTREVDRQNIRQFEVARGVNLLSPGFAYQYAVESLLGSGIYRYRNFLDQAYQYRTALREFIRGRDAADADSPHVLYLADFMSDKPIDPDDIPRFKEEPLPFADGLAGASVPITILMLEAAIAFFFALRAFNRTELSG